MVRIARTFLFVSWLAAAMACASATAGASEPWRSGGCENPRLQTGNYTEDNWPIPQTGENRQTVGRTYVVYVPKHHEQPQGIPLPIVIALHGTDTGAGGQGAGLIKGVHLQEASDKYGFVVVAPNAWPWSTWTTVDSDVVDRRGFSDVEFVRRLLDILDEKLCVDRNRIFVTGGSNGGFMAVRIARAGAAGELGLLESRTAKETPRRIAAIAPVVAFPPPEGSQLNAHIPDDLALDPFRGRIPQAAILARDSKLCAPPAGSIRPPDKAIPMHVFYGNEDRLIANSACFGSYLRSALIPASIRPAVHEFLCGCNGRYQCPHKSGIVGDVGIMEFVARCMVNSWAVENGCTSDWEEAKSETPSWGRPLSTVVWKCSGVENSRGDTAITIFDVRDTPEHPNNPEIPEGHIWPGGVGADGGFSATEAIWQFFSTHSR